MKQLPATLLTLLWSAVLLSAQAPGTLDASFGDGGQQSVLVNKVN